MTITAPARPRTWTGRRAPLTVDEDAARRVAAHFLAGDSPAPPALVHAAYRQLVQQTDELLHHVLRHSPRSVRLAPTAVETPYASDDELIDSVRASAVLEIPRADRDRGHSLLGCEPGGEHDRFRALHDLVGHVIPGYGFDRDGEFSAWSLQHRQYRGLARWALATELHAHHSVRWTTGELAEPRATLVAPRLLRSSLSAGRSVDLERPTGHLAVVTELRAARSSPSRPPAAMPTPGRNPAELVRDVA